MAKEAKEKNAENVEKILTVSKQHFFKISFGCLCSLMGAVWWLSATHAEIQNNTKDINENKQVIVKAKKDTLAAKDNINATLIKINTRLSRIEGALGVKSDDK